MDTPNQTTTKYKPEAAQNPIQTWSSQRSLFLNFPAKWGEEWYEKLYQRTEYKEQAQWPEYIIGSPLFENSYLGHECVDVISM